MTQDQEHDELTAQQVREIRDRLGLRRRELAERLGVSTHTVESWELDRRPCRGPAANLLRALEVKW